VIKRIQNVYYVTDDMNETVTFYRDVLGLGVKFKDGERWTQLDAGGSNFALSSLEEAAKGAKGAVVVFEVDGLEEMATQIAAAGGEVLGTRDMGSHGRTLTFRDPVGNIAQLYERAPKP
jgi:predicted enzyme related to lactoylglutathione lyase